MPASMFNKPTSLPVWATDSNAAIAEPSVAKKGKGWEFAEKPPHEWFNWWMNNVYTWVGYVSELDASDLPATHGGATTTTQAAITDLGTRLGSAQTGIDTLVSWATTAQNSLNNLNAQAERQQRATSGGVMISGAPWPNSAAQSVVQPAGSWGYDLGQGAYAQGLEFANLTVQGAMRFSNVRTLFVLRVHGDLTLNGPLRFLAHTGLPSPMTNRVQTTTSTVNGTPQTPTSTSFGGAASSTPTPPFGGAGIIGAGGPYITWVNSSFPGFTMLTTTTVQGVCVDPTRGYLRDPGLFSSADVLAEHLTQAGVAGAPMAAAPWLGGGGQAGGSSKGLNGTWFTGAAGGGAAMLLVSGDIILGPNGRIDCSGEDGSTAASMLVGGGGGGGGALYIYCGGQIRFTGASTPSFLANGGRGGRADTTTSTQDRYGGCGGGGGLVVLCARNADASLHCKASGGAAGWLSANNASSGNAGSAGRVVAVRALPSMLL